MKNYNFYQLTGVILVIIALFAQCEMVEEDLQGNGNITEVRKNVTSFDDIHIDGIINVYLSQGESYKLKVETDDNLQHLVTVSNTGSSLYVSTDSEEEFEATVMNVYISSPDFSTLELTGVNALFCEDTLDLEHVIINKHNTGHLSFMATLDKLTVKSSGVGDIELTGKAEFLNITNSMVGDVKAFNFKTLSTVVEHEGTGNVEVYAVNKIDVTISGVGNVYCKGAPQDISKISEGTGRFYLVE